MILPDNFPSLSFHWKKKTEGFKFEVNANF